MRRACRCAVRRLPLPPERNAVGSSLVWASLKVARSAVVIVMPTSTGNA
jgi:hypothetical protein